MLKFPLLSPVSLLELAINSTASSLTADAGTHPVLPSTMSTP